MSRPRTHLVFASVAVVDGDAVLLVQEGKADVRGAWNLPGGGVEPAETVLDAARREVHEETGLTVEPDGLVGVANGPGWLRFVLHAAHPRSVLVAGPDILAARWWPLDEVERLADGALHPPAALLRSTVGALRAGAVGSLDLLSAYTST